MLYHVIQLLSDKKKNRNLNVAYNHKSYFYRFCEKDDEYFFSLDRSFDRSRRFFYTRLLLHTSLTIRP